VILYFRAGLVHTYTCTYKCIHMYTVYSAYIFSTNDTAHTVMYSVCRHSGQTFACVSYIQMQVSIYVGLSCLFKPRMHGTKFSA